MVRVASAETGLKRGWYVMVVKPALIGKAGELLFAGELMRRGVDPEYQRRGARPTCKSIVQPM